MQTNEIAPMPMTGCSLSERGGVLFPSHVDMVFRGGGQPEVGSIDRLSPVVICRDTDEHDSCMAFQADASRDAEEASYLRATLLGCC